MRHATPADFAFAAWRGASLKDILESELQPFADRVTLDGDPIVLSPQAAQNFALASHELVTNAAKYGSLSKPGGEVLVDWSVSGNGQDNGVLKFRWRERGGPTVSLPGRKGFGSSLLESTLGKGRIEYQSEGVNYEIDIPLANIRPQQG